MRPGARLSGRACLPEKWTGQRALCLSGPGMDAISPSAPVTAWDQNRTKNPIFLLKTLCPWSQEWYLPSSPESI